MSGHKSSDRKILNAKITSQRICSIVSFRLFATEHQFYYLWVSVDIMESEKTQDRPNHLSPHYYQLSTWLPCRSICPIITTH